MLRFAWRLVLAVVISGAAWIVCGQTALMDGSRVRLAWPNTPNAMWPQGELSFRLLRSRCVSPIYLTGHCIGSEWSEMYAGPLNLFYDATVAAGLRYTYVVDVYANGYEVYRFQFPAVTTWPTTLTAPTLNPVEVR